MTFCNILYYEITTVFIDKKLYFSYINTIFRYLYLLINALYWYIIYIKAINIIYITAIDISSKYMKKLTLNMI